jgi:hypothetical protein
VEFATKLQEKERFLQWVASSLLVSAEQESILRYANGVLFEALKKTLPMESMWMANQRDAQGKMTFFRLGMLVIEVYSKQTDGNASAQIPFSMPVMGMKGSLSRKKGTLVESEEKTEEHNKKVITRYKPGDSSNHESDEDDESADLEAIHKIVQDKRIHDRDFKESNNKRSTDKGRGASDDRETEMSKNLQQEIANSPAENLFMKVISQLLVKRDDKPEFIDTPRHRNFPPQQNVYECNAYKSGTCRFGSNCFYSHTGDVNKQTFQQKRRHSISPQRDVIDNQRRSNQVGICFDYQKGNCARSSCRYTHDAKQQQQPAQRQNQRHANCRQMEEKGSCNSNGCDLYHGLFDRYAQKLCNYFLENKSCPHLFQKSGCRFSHNQKDKYQEREYRRPREIKNATGPRKADTNNRVLLLK